MTQNLLKTDTLGLLLNALNANPLDDNASRLASLNSECQQLLQEATLHQQAHWAAHMTPNLAPYSLLGQHIAGMHQGNLLSPDLYPLLKKAETTALNWIKAHFHQSHAGFTHGGSYSNLEALWQARDSRPDKAKIVYGSRACHYSVQKACDILGLEFKSLDTDSHDRLLPQALLKACKQQQPLAIILNIGTSAAGSIDPLAECVAIANHYTCWLHIDAAWGGAMAMLPEHRSGYNVLAHADTISFDPHKTLFLPRPCSVLMSRHRSRAVAAIDYLDTAPETRLAGSYGGELFLPLWLNLQLLGEHWFYQKTRQRLAQARQFVMQLSELTSWPIISSETGIVCFEAPNENKLEQLVKQGVFSKATVNNRRVCRAVFASYDTQANRLIEALRPYL